MNRRKLLSLTIQGVGLAIVGAVAGPALIHSLSPLLASEPAEDWNALGNADEFPVGKVIKTTLSSSSELAPAKTDEKAVYVWRKSEEQFIVYSRACTDLGCPVTYDPGSEWFYCPCHGGIFDKEGERKAGPPRAPLWRYQTRIRSGNLEINLKSVPPMA